LEIDWNTDFADPSPIFIDVVSFENDQASFILWEDFNWDWLMGRYYQFILLYPVLTLAHREDRMKTARFILAAIKDIEVALSLCPKK